MQPKWSVQCSQKEVCFHSRHSESHWVHQSEPWQNAKLWSLSVFRACSRVSHNGWNLLGHWHRWKARTRCYHWGMPQPDPANSSVNLQDLDSIPREWRCLCKYWSRDWSRIIQISKGPRPNQRLIVCLSGIDNKVKSDEALTCIHFEKAYFDWGPTRDR